jgi:hypothetical protein
MVADCIQSCAVKVGAVDERLRDDLVLCAFAAGQRLSESELGACDAVSRTPVREALARLEHEGLLAGLATVYAGTDEPASGWPPPRCASSTSPR